MRKSPCDSCDKVCAAEGRGCGPWRDYFVRNWNENISVKPKKQTKEVFRYEHPDMIREGIVFESSCSV